MKWLRRLAMAGLRLLPRPLRHSLIRRSARVKESELAAVDAVRIAQSIDEYVEAMKLVYDGYVDRGIMTPHDSRVRMTPYLALPSTIIFVAMEGTQVAGTLSLVLDSPLGLPMQKIYGEEVQRLRDQGRVPAEVGALCVARGKRGAGIAFLLYKMMYLTATRLLRVDDLVIAVHPKVADLYMATLLFETIGPVRSYPSLERSALAQALRLDLASSEATFKARWGHLGPTPANPYWLYCERVDPQLVLPAPSQLEGLRDLHRRASMKLAALRPDIVFELDAAEFSTFRAEMKR